jgi:alkanesulfonate monooxygenase SsuD/methylene tetrahydromethanopterin reductase-like flavin-dependent oxidoreductase (luciferase family)
MRFGAHLPLIDFDGTGLPSLPDYVEAAREAGLTAISSNDHLVFQRPWLDGIVALASVVERSADLTLATTASLPVVRGPAALAKSAAALDLLSGGRFVLGVGPGSSPRDYAAVRVPFEERWPRFDEAVRVLRSELTDAKPPTRDRFYDAPALEPRPSRSIPIWIGSWGSPAGLRRVARLGDGWLASAYNTTPDQIVAGRDTLHAALRSAGRDERGFPIALATMWMYLTDSRSEAKEKLVALSTMLDRDPETLAGQVLIGPIDECAAKLARYAEAGVVTVFVWPIGDPVRQLGRFGAEVMPHLR